MIGMGLLIKLRKNQTGFSAIEVLLILIFIAVLAFIGWYAWHNHQNSSYPASNTQAHSGAIGDQSKSQSSQAAASDSLAISQWGVKIKMDDAAKVSYTYQKSDGKVDPTTGDVADSSVTLSIKPEYLQDKSCKLAIGITRYEDSKLDNFFKESATRIDGYDYLSGGSPYNCGSKADNSLNEEIRNSIEVVPQ